MTEFQTVRMGELHVGRGSGRFRTLLGSCVGLTLHDRQARVGGMAHILLAESAGGEFPPGKYVDTALPELIRLIQAQTRAGVNLVADIAGGADMFDTRGAASVGALNIAAIDNALHRSSIPVRSRTCGGNRGRWMTLDIATGVVTIDDFGVASAVVPGGGEVRP